MTVRVEITLPQEKNQPFVPDCLSLMWRPVTLNCFTALTVSSWLQHRCQVQVFALLSLHLWWQLCLLLVKIYQELVSILKWPTQNFQLHSVGADISKNHTYERRSRVLEGGEAILHLRLWSYLNCFFLLCLSASIQGICPESQTFRINQIFFKCCHAHQSVLSLGWGEASDLLPCRQPHCCDRCQYAGQDCYYY